MPKFAGLLQQHLGQASESKNSHAWKPQAEMFLGLLQSMGGQVPESAANQTRHYVDEIIKLLSTSSGDIYADAETTKDYEQGRIDKQYADLQSAETAANKELADTTAADSDLADCYAHLKEIASNHSVHCGEKELPEACKKKNNTKVHTFDVADKDTWTCDFGDGKNPTKCTDATSPLKTDLTSKRDALRLAYQQWKAENKTCNDDLTAERTLCQNTNTSYYGKQAACEKLYYNVSDHLCNFRDKIDKWNTSKSTLTATQGNAKTLLGPKEKEWTDLNLIICMLKKFRARPKMTFTDADYGECETEAKGLVFVGEINTKETETETLKSGSLYKETCLAFSFSAGLPRSSWPARQQPPSPSSP